MYAIRSYYEGGEGVIRYLRSSRRYGADKGRFAGIGQTEQAHIGQQQQLHAQIALLAGRAVGLLARSPVDRTLETGIAEAVKAALGHHQALTALGQVTQHLAGVLIGGAGA